MKKVYLLLGSNTGNSREILDSACSALANEIGKIIKQSSLYKTEPWGVKDQPAFLNQLVICETELSPAKLISTILIIEKNLGRSRVEKWGPRTIDIDILYYENEIIVTENLKIPHPEIQNRKFALIPLVEIAAEFKHPVFNITNEEMLLRSDDNLKVDIID